MKKTGWLKISFSSKYRWVLLLGLLSVISLILLFYLPAQESPLSPKTNAPPNESSKAIPLGQKPEGRPVPPPLNLSDAINTFGLQLFSKLLTEDKGQAVSDRNILISPASLALALSMTYNGAQGKTKAAMAQTLSIQGWGLPALNQFYAKLTGALKKPSDPQVELSIANSLWARQGIPFKSDFFQRVQTTYDASLDTLDFSSPSAADTINHWVDSHTRGRIKEIVSPHLPRNAILYLINAVYFKGMWSKAFKKDNTREENFAELDGTTKKHPLMHQGGKYLYYRNRNRAGKFQVVSLPYGNERYSMIVFLPDQDSSLKEFYAQLTPQTLKNWIETLYPSYSSLYQASKRYGEVTLPKFTLKYEKTMNDVLKALGMKIAFDKEKADFGAMVDLEKLVGMNVSISGVKHKTFIKVDEEGTEAAAVTSTETVEIGACSREGCAEPPQKFTMIIDHPFFFVIRDNQTGVILFMGSVVTPTL